MTDAGRRNLVVTPEAVAVDLDVAGLGSRAIAQIIDGLILLAALVAEAILFFNVSDGGTAAAIVFGVTAFVTFWGYFPLFEGVWNGQTPGKRAQRIRVVLQDGQPVTWGPVLIRNLVRIVDFLPTYYIVGAAAMLATRRSQRLGDLAAGTMVVRERRASAPAPLVLPPDPDHDDLVLQMDTTRLTDREYGLVRSFLERRPTLDPFARRTLAADVARALRAAVGGPAAGMGSDEAFLEAVARAYRRRFDPAGPTGGPPPERPDR